MNSQTKVMGANVKLAGAMTTATKSLASMNKVMNPEKIGQTMQEFEKATSKMNMTEEMMNDALDDILNESGDEEEGESIVQQVLDEIGIDVSAKVNFPFIYSWVLDQLAIIFFYFCFRFLKHLQLLHV